MATAPFLSPLLVADWTVLLEITPTDIDKFCRSLWHPLLLLATAAWYTPGFRIFPAPRYERICLIVVYMCLCLSLTILLNDNRYGPGNRPHWALNKTRFPNLIKALNEEPDMGIRKRVSSLYQALAG